MRHHFFIAEFYQGQLGETSGNFAVLATERVMSVGGKTAAETSPGFPSTTSNDALLADVCEATFSNSDNWRSG